MKISLSVGANGSVDMKNKIIAFLTAIVFVLGLFLALQFVAQSVKGRKKSIRFIQNDFEDKIF